MVDGLLLDLSGPRQREAAFRHAGIVRSMNDLGGYEQMLRLPDARPEVEDVFAANDRIATGALWALVQSRRHVPVDASLVDYGDIRPDPLVHPGLGTVRHSARDMGTEWRRLLLGTPQGADGSPRSIPIAPDLIVRESRGAEEREEVL